MLDEAEARRAFATTKRKAHAVSRLATWVRRWHDGKRARAFVRWCRFVLNHEASCLRGGLRADCLRRCLRRGVQRWARHDASRAFRAWKRHRDAFNADVLLYGRQTAKLRRLLSKHARRTTSWTLRKWSQKRAPRPGPSGSLKVPRPRGPPVARRGLLELVRLLRFQEITKHVRPSSRAARGGSAAAAVPRIQQMAPRPRAVDATFKCSRAPRAPGAAHRAAIGECAARRRPRRLVRAETQSVAGRAGAAPFQLRRCAKC